MEAAAVVVEVEAEVEGVEGDLRLAHKHCTGNTGCNYRQNPSIFMIPTIASTSSWILTYFILRDPDRRKLLIL